MADFDELYDALKAEVSVLQDRFITQFIPTNPEHTPAHFEHEVKAFSVLSHAAFEEFVEAVSELIMQKIETDLLAKKTTISTACLLSAYGIKLDISETDDLAEDTCFNRLRNAICNAKELHSKTLKDNHGFSPKYLRKLLIPVGINMPTGPTTDSLKKLAEARGSFAHTMSKMATYGEYKRAKKILTPDEASNAALDCLVICEEIKNRAKSID